MQLKNLTLGALLLLAQTLSAQTAPAPATAPAAQPAAPQAPAPSAPAQPALYTFPGFVYERGGEWIGSDYLYNLQSDIGLVVEVLMPENQNITIDSKALTDACVKAFQNHKIEPRLNPPAGVSALPFFYMQIMAFPTENNVVTLCTGSLLEAITVTRIATTQKDSVLQGITWEKKTMFMSTPDTFEQDLSKTIDDIANTFGERYQLFAKMKAQAPSTKPGMHFPAKKGFGPIKPNP